MTEKVQKDEFTQYLSEVKSWETNKVLDLQKSKTLAWRVATAAGVIAGAAVFAVAGLTPLKTEKVTVVTVDNATGIVNVAAPLKNGKDSYEEAINKYFVQQYVRFREGYSLELVEEFYNQVGIMSSEAQQLEYHEDVNPKNQHSPSQKWGVNAKVLITVKSTSFIKPNIALVRYVREVDRPGERPTQTHWAATVAFQYSNASMAESDRARNPLGFQVVEYRRDPDSSGGERPVAQRPAAPAAAAPSATVFPGQSPVVPPLQAPTN